MARIYRLAKEGEKASCFLCGKEKMGSPMWIITRMEEFIPTLECETCGQIISLEKDVAREKIKISKKCSCPLTLSLVQIADCNPEWKNTKYFYCDDCFKQAYGNILFAHLGDNVE